jgi:hypothetical protein
MSATQTITASKSAVSAATVAGVLVLTFADGRVLSVNPAELSADIQREAILHGLKQKLVDAAAISRDITTGRSATLNDKYVAVHEVHARITAVDGTWNKIRTGGDGPMAKDGLLVRAIMQLSGDPRDVVVAKVASLNKSQQAALRANARVAQIIASFKTDDSVDGDDILAGLLGELEAGDDVEGDNNV